MRRNSAEDLTLPHTAIPTYALYGEFLSGSIVDDIHHEPLYVRSSRHGWDIQLHRHRHLAQVFVFRSTGVFIRAGEIEFTARQPTILFVPPMVTHGFKFPQDTDGDVITLPASLIDAALATPRLLSADQPDQFDPVAQTMHLLARAFHQVGAERAALMSHLVQTLLIYLRAGHETAPAPAPEMTRHEQQAHAFCAAIEHDFASTRSILDYARALGVSAPHLTRVSKKVLGATPNELITRRRMIEAERLLKFTRHKIGTIAQRAGYGDTPYFIRAFKRRHAMSPGAYRKASLA